MGWVSHCANYLLIHREGLTELIEYSTDFIKATEQDQLFSFNLKTERVAAKKSLILSGYLGLLKGLRCDGFADF
jgi:hypothetical protein